MSVQAGKGRRRVVKYSTGEVGAAPFPSSIDGAIEREKKPRRGVGIGRRRRKRKRVSPLPLFCMGRSLVRGLDSRS